MVDIANHLTLLWKYGYIDSWDEWKEVWIDEKGLSDEEVDHLDLDSETVMNDIRTMISRIIKCEIDETLDQIRIEDFTNSFLERIRLTEIPLKGRNLEISYLNAVNQPTKLQITSHGEITVNQNRLIRQYLQQDDADLEKKGVTFGELQSELSNLSRPDPDAIINLIRETDSVIFLRFRYRDITQMSGRNNSLTINQTLVPITMAAVAAASSNQSLPSDINTSNANNLSEETEKVDLSEFTQTAVFTEMPDINEKNEAESKDWFLTSEDLNEVEKEIGLRRQPLPSAD